MATSIVFNGSTYSVPANREPRGWGTSLSAFLVDVGNNALSKAGGNFTLTADANFGANFGLVIKYIKSASANVAQTGVVRLANNEAIVWRNAANDGDIEFKVNADDDIELGGTLRLDEVTVFSDTDKEMDVGETLFNTTSTGCTSFDGFTITGGGTTFTVGAGTGQIVDHETQQVINVSWPAFTGQTALTANGITHVYITRDAAIVTTLTLPDGTVRRDNIVLGRAGTVAGTIISTATTTVSNIGIGNTLVDHMEAISAFRISGITMSPNGANLNINRSAGSIFRSGVNFEADPKDPNVRIVTSATPVTLLYTTSTTFVGNSAVVLPGNYESAPGVVTAYLGSGNQATIQRIYQYPGAGLTTAVQYGSTIYASLSAAVQAIGTETFTPNTSHADNAVLVAILCVTKGCTSLSDTSTARIFIASRFGESSVGAAGASVSTLQNVYNNSSDPEVTTDSTRGAVSFKRGSAADSDNVIEVQNGAGSTTLGIRGDGTVTGATLLTSTVDDYIDINEESAPSTPSAGKVRVYAKSDKKVYKKDSSGVESELGAGGAGSGEISAVANPSGATDTTGWTGVTRVTTGSPLDPSVPTALSIANTATGAGVESATTGGYYSISSLAPGLRAWNLKVEFWFTTPATDNYAVSVYQGSTRLPLSTDTSGATNLPKATTGKFTATFDSSTASAYSLNITRTTGATGAAIITNVIIGPGAVGQVPAVGNWNTFSPEIGGSATDGTFTYTAQKGKWKQTTGSMEMEFRVDINAVSAAPTGFLTVKLPYINGVSGTRYTTDVTGISSSGAIVGHGLYSDASPSANIVARVELDAATGGLWILGSSAATPTLAASDSIRLWLSIPIAEWAGSGLSIGPGSEPEYAYNTDVSSTASVTASGFANGPGGVAFNAAWVVGTTYTRRVRFNHPVQSSDLLSLEVLLNGDWASLSDVLYGANVQNATVYGARLAPVSGAPTDIDVAFGNGGYNGGASFAANGSPWANLTALNWRVRKYRNGQLPFAKATSTNSGLVAPRKGQTALTLTSGSPTVSTTVRAVGVYYQDQDGNHRLKFNIVYTVASAARTLASVTISGVTFKNVVNFLQPVTTSHNAGAIATIGYVTPNTGTLTTEHASGTTTLYAFSGDVELDSKPSWA